MSSKRAAKKLAEKNGNLDLIKKVVDKNRISIGEIQDLAEIDHPLFSFKYLQKNSICDCKDAAFFYEFLFRLKKLSELGWDEIRKSGRHSFGMEKIPGIRVRDINAGFVYRNVAGFIFLRNQIAGGGSMCYCRCIACMSFDRCYDIKKGAD